MLGRTATTLSGNSGFAQVGDVIDNGFQIGGARMYPWSTGLAITPSSYYSDYIGSPGAYPTTPPASALTATAGAPTSGATAALAKPFGASSPLPWVILFLFAAVFATHQMHYKARRD